MIDGKNLVPSLNKIYGEDWHVRLNPSGIPAATYRGQFTEEQASKGLAMTLWEVNGEGPLAEQLATQTALLYGP